MLFMVIERFKDRDAKAVYRRLREQGRGAPAGLRYVDSWVEANFDRCFQLMECDDARLVQQWVAFWGDLVQFEIVPVVREVNLARALDALKKAGLWVVGLAGEAPVTLAQAGLGGRRVALVLGAEGEGMRRLTREHCDELARLPIAPEMESLNVSAAAAVALYELARG